MDEVGVVGLWPAWFFRIGAITAPRAPNRAPPPLGTTRPHTHTHSPFAGRLAFAQGAAPHPRPRAGRHVGAARGLGAGKIAGGRERGPKKHTSVSTCCLSPLYGRVGGGGEGGGGRAMRGVPGQPWCAPVPPTCRGPRPLPPLPRPPPPTRHHETMLQTTQEAKPGSGGRGLGGPPPPTLVPSNQPPLPLQSPLTPSSPASSATSPRTRCTGGRARWTGRGRGALSASTATTRGRSGRTGRRAGGTASWWGATWWRDGWVSPQGKGNKEEGVGGGQADGKTYIKGGVLCDVLFSFLLYPAPTHTPPALSISLSEGSSVALTRFLSPKNKENK